MALLHTSGRVGLARRYVLTGLLTAIPIWLLHRRTLGEPQSAATRAYQYAVAAIGLIAAVGGAASLTIFAFDRTLLVGGTSQDVITAATTMVAEGVRNTEAIHRLAEAAGIEMPITAAMYEILYDGKTPRQVLKELMARELKDEATL